MGGASVGPSVGLPFGGYDPEFFLGGEEETLAFKLLKVGRHLRHHVHPCRCPQEPRRVPRCADDTPCVNLRPQWPGC